jgi:hypothetical protein
MDEQAEVFSEMWQDIFDEVGESCLREDGGIYIGDGVIIYEDGKTKIE